MACIQREQLSILLCLLFLHSSHCNDMYTDRLTFVFNIPSTIESSCPPHVVITTTSLESVTATLNVPGTGIDINVSVTGYHHADITLPTSVRLERGDGKQYKTIVLQASGIISVHAIDNTCGHGDGFLALSTSQLGTSYYVASFISLHHDFPSFFCVSALYDDTRVNIKTNIGQEDHVNLTAFESFRFDGAVFQDLTGSAVHSNKPIAVVSGVRTKIPQDKSYPDGLLEQLIPGQDWGKNFVLSPFLGRHSGYIYRVLTANRTTMLDITSKNAMQQDKIEHKQLEAHSLYEGNGFEEVVTSIVSDQPILVIQYMKGFSSEYPPRGDPSMTLVTPLESFTNNVSFPVIALSPTDMLYYITVNIECSYVNGLVLDDSISMVDLNQLTAADNSMCSLRTNVTEGVHILVHPNPFAKFSVLVYGICQTCGTSYAYPTGLIASFLFNLSAEIPVTSPENRMLSLASKSTKTSHETTPKIPGSITTSGTTSQEARYTTTPGYELSSSTETTTDLYDNGTTIPEANATSSSHVKATTGLPGPHYLATIGFIVGGVILLLTVLKCFVVAIKRRNVSTSPTSHEEEMDDGIDMTVLDSETKSGDAVEGRLDNDLHPSNATYHKNSAQCETVCHDMLKTDNVDDWPCQDIIYKPDRPVSSFEDTLSMYTV